MSETGVLVVGATGTQGGSVATHLLADDREFDVYALTRDPDQPAAQGLERRGATVVQGDLGTPGSFAGVMEVVDAVFGVTDYWEAGARSEIDHGINLANVAAEVGVDHFVFSSVAGADPGTEVPMIRSKVEVERHVEHLGLPATVVRPGYFMQNFELRRSAIREEEKLALPLAPSATLPLVDAEDIGRFVARVLADPGRFVDETVALAGEELTLGEMAAVFGDVLGSEPQTVHIPIDVARSQFGDDYAALFEWYNEGAPTGVVGRLYDRYDFAPTALGEYLVASGWDRSGLPDADGVDADNREWSRIQ